ncbi:MAG: hypothetical protein HYY03_00285, partial [Chloroflexi bacterium]|nr:hypothetical protein [Chloroflexota bacterium]
MVRETRRRLVVLGTPAIFGALTILAVVLLVGPPGSRGAAEQQTSDITLSPGWNLISLPLVPADPDPATVLASIADKLNSAWAYDSSQAGSAQASPWLSYDPDVPDFLNTLTAMGITMGFWVNMQEAATLAVMGSAPPPETEIAVAPGWNFVGYPSGYALLVAEALAGIEFNSVWAYDPSLSPSPWQSYDPDVPPALNSLQEITPGRGYALNGIEETAFVVANAETTVAQGAGAGGTELEVASTEGFAEGDNIRIDPGGPSEEDNVVGGLGSFMLGYNLANAHAVGTKIIKLPPLFLPKLHYKCYQITGPALNATVVAQTQFGVEELQLREPVDLCAPALKNNQGYLHAPHLKCYAIQNGNDPPQVVNLITQFGVEKNVAVGQARLLCVAAQKQVLLPTPGQIGHAPPPVHWKCYDITGPAPNKIVNLQTQFGIEEQVPVGQPKLLCAPALKTFQGKTSGYMKLPHLKCYQIDGSDPPHVVKLTTQFGVEPTVEVGHADML